MKTRTFKKLKTSVIPPVTDGDRVWERATSILMSRQEPLGTDFEKVLHENLWDLYECDNE